MKPTKLFVRVLTNGPTLKKYLNSYPVGWEKDWLISKTFLRTLVQARLSGKPKKLGLE
jgi:hypothetical protein